MSIQLIPYGQLPNGNYGVLIDPSSRKPLASVVEVLSALPALTSTDNFEGRLVFNKTDSSLSVFATYPSNQWKSLDGIPASVGAVAGSPPSSPSPQDGELFWDLDTQVLFVWNGSLWEAAGGHYAAQVVENTYTGDGTTTAYPIGSATVVSAQYVEVFLDGIRQRPVVDYTVVGTTVSFVTAPVTGMNIHVRALIGDVIVQNTQITSANYTASVSETDFSLGLYGVDPAGVFVFLDGAIQQGSGVDYDIISQDTTITSLAKINSTTARVATTQPHSITSGATVTLVDFVEPEYNSQSFIVSNIPSSTQFDITVLASDPASGTPNAGCHFSPPFVNDYVQFGTAMTGGEAVSMRVLKSVVAGIVGEVNTLASVGTGTGLDTTKVGTTLQMKSLLAGPNVSLVDLGNEIQIGTSVGEGFEDRIGINTSSYSVTGTDSYVGVRNTTAPVTVNLTTVTQIPSNSGRKITIKDESGGAGSNAISVVTTGTIDGAVSPYVINTNYGSVTLVMDGTNWYIVAQKP